MNGHNFRKLRKKVKGESAFTLIEVVLGIALFLLVFMAAYNFLGESYSAVYRSEVDSQASMLATAIVEEIRTEAENDWDNIDDDDFEITNGDIDDILDIEDGDYSLNRDYNLNIELESDDFSDDTACKLTVELEWENDGEEESYDVRTIIRNRSTGE